MPYAGKSTSQAGRSRWGWKDIGGKRYNKCDAEPWQPWRYFDPVARKERQEKNYDETRNAEYYKNRVQQLKEKKE